MTANATPLYLVAGYVTVLDSLTTIHTSCGTAASV